MKSYESKIREMLVGIISYNENDNQINVSTKNVFVRLSDLAKWKEELGVKEIEVCLPHDTEKFNLHYTFLK